MDPLVARNISILVGTLLLAAVIGFGFVIRNGTYSTNQAQDLVTIAQGLQKAYVNQNYQYGAAVIPSSTLINAGKVDPNTVTGTNIMSRWQTAIVITGAGTAFTLALTGIPSNNCVDLMLDQSLQQYATSIGITGGTARTEPVSQANAAADCGTSGTVNLTATMIGHP
ncbi:MAG TPA: type 4 pilus major pilin [Rhizomicrobium sp.]|nr:type 4 pilus major pilin [Rhizomicrobium sp.]